MAICTECGLVLHEDDVKTHKCDTKDVPKKGEKSVNRKKADAVLDREPEPTEG